MLLNDAKNTRDARLQKAIDSRAFAVLISRFPSLDQDGERSWGIEKASYRVFTLLMR